MPEERREVLGREPGRAPRAWMTWLGVAVVAIAAVVAVRQSGSAPSPRPPSPTPTVPRGVDGPPWGLVPQTRMSVAGRTTVHLVFPDGSTAEMSYATGSGLAGLGVRPHTSGWLTSPGDGCCLRPILAPPQGGAWFATGGPPEDRLDGADGGRVTVVPPPVAGPLSAYLVFGFGRYQLGVQSDREDRMDAARRRLWAENLHGRVTADGFLVLRGGGPLRLAAPPDERAASSLGEPIEPHDGPQLRFGRGFMAEYGIGEYADPTLIFEPVTHCQKSMAIAGYLELAVRDSVCKGSSMRVWIGGDDRFVRRVLPDIRVWNVRLAPR